MTNAESPGEQVCSRAGCTNPALWNVNWRNPKIHTPDRVKVWLACDEHRNFLFHYLATRSFPVVVTPLDEHVDRVPDAPVDAP
ncbi:hypothetical protein [Parafrigoribacterium soli]|uniref:hypothetical protein n=1 Tax=Parafrigoribacterium soli TaxID=3144663 RepID=UPI0032EEF5CA